MIKILLITVLFAFALTQAYTDTCPDPVCTENGNLQGCYGGGPNSQGACVTTFCTTNCGGTTATLKFPIQSSADWHDYVTMQGVFQPTGGSHFSTAKDCSAIQAYRYNVVAWGYDVGTIIDARVARLNAFCLANAAPPVSVPATCPTGYTLNGNNQCQMVSNPGCPTGYTFFNGVCTQTPTCSAGYYLGPNNVCVLDPTCSNGYTLNGASCTSQLGPNCPTGYTYANGICTSQVAPTCNSGYTLGPNSDVCTSIVTAQCPSTHSLVGTQCILNPTCDAGFTFVNGACTSTITPTCPAGYTLSGNVCNKNAGTVTAAATTLEFEGLENILNN